LTFLTLLLLMVLPWASSLAVNTKIQQLPQPQALAEKLKYKECVKGNPTFNDTTYYAAAHNADPEDLMDTLLSIIDNHNIFDYACVWTIMEDADEAADSRYVKTWYSGEEILKTDRDTGSETYVWNREHLWPTSHGFSSSSAVAYTDTHHLRACQKQVNSGRGDKDFRYGGTTQCIYPYNAQSNCNVYWKSASNSIEVPLAYRGDTARAAFYMATRYKDGDTNTGSLRLVNAVTMGTGLPQLGWLCDLVAWHLEDPVSAEERARNDVIYDWQENRNPYIDHPEWVEIAFNTC